MPRLALRSRRTPSVRLAPIVVMTAALALAMAGCSPMGAASPDPSAPCAGADEQRAAGFHPDLEALLPTELDGQAPVQRDSGRYCSARSLGTLAEAGFGSVDFAGATWSADEASGLAVVAYRAPGLTLDVLADSFARGADDARSVNQVHASSIEVAGRPAIRIDAVMRQTPQSVVLWATDAPETFIVVIGSGVDDARLQAAVAAASSASGGP